MKRSMVLILLLVLGLALSSCDWATPLRSFMQATPAPIAIPAEGDILTAPYADEGMVTEKGPLTTRQEQVSPSIVDIRVTQKMELGVNLPFRKWPDLSFFSDLADLPRLPDRVYRHGERSGFVWDDEGHIVTNNHLVKGASSVDVRLSDGTVIEARVVGLDEQCDIAVLRVDPSTTQLHPATLGDSDMPQVGQLAVGNPFGRVWATMGGFVSALECTAHAGGNPFAIPNITRTGTAANPGNLRGPLLNSEGQVVGMNAVAPSQAQTNTGVGFVVPINIVKKIVRALIASAEYPYPWLGIEGRDLSSEDVDVMGLSSRRGVLVTAVVQDSPADRVELHESDLTIFVDGVQTRTGGDVIVSVDGKPVGGMSDLIAYLMRNTRPGQKVTLEVLRDGATILVEVTLGERPGDPTV